MSGGSFNYLYRRDIEELIEDDSDLQDAYVEIKSLGYANDLADDIYDFIMYLTKIKIIFNKRFNNLKSILQTLEHWYSCDSSEEAFKEELKLYRLQKTKNQRRL